MRSGTVFDIKEFAVHDGPGIRTTIFLKGCPLSCTWCHNPESQQMVPQTIIGPAGGRVAGEEYSSERLAGLINAQADILRASEGGVTFSGGEPLMQAEFVAEVIDRLERTHVLLDSSGYASETAFHLVVSRCDLVFFDLKLMDNDMHQRYTGKGNGRILANLRALSGMGVPYVVRVPLIPGVTDTGENLAAIARFVADLAGLVRVDLLPYNRAAGGKYRSAGMTFEPGYDETLAVNADTRPFEDAGLAVSVR